MNSGRRFNRGLRSGGPLLNADGKPPGGLACGSFGLSRGSFFELHLNRNTATLLQVSIEHVHVRFEAEQFRRAQNATTGAYAKETTDKAETVMTLGLTMRHLSADSVDAEGRPTFDVGGLAARLYKHAQLKDLAVYFDPAATPLAGKAMSNAAHTKVGAAELIRWFEAEAASLAKQATDSAQRDTHLMRPVSGTARYSRRGNKEEVHLNEPAHSATLSLQQVSLRLSDAQLHAAQSLAEVFSLSSMRAPHAHLRPRGSHGVRGNASEWWRYAVAAVRLRTARRGLRFAEVTRVAKCRRRYLPAYKQRLTSKKLDPAVASSLTALEADLDESTLVLFRCVVRTQVAAEQRQLVPSKPAKRGWFGFGGGGGGDKEESSSPKSSSSDNAVGFSAADLSQLADVFLIDSESSGKGRASDDPMALLYIFKVEMQKASLQLAQADDGLVIVDGCMTDLQCSAHLYPVTRDMRLMLGSYYVDVPEGRLLASSPGSREVLTASVVLNPPQRAPNTNVVRARVAPCLVSVYYDSVGRLSRWVRPKHTLEIAALSNAMAASVDLSGGSAPSASGDVVAAATPATPDVVAASVLDLQVELSAPKIRLPVGGKYQGEMQLVLDLGRFELKSKEVRTRDIGVIVVPGSFSPPVCRCLPL